MNKLDLLIYCDSPNQAEMFASTIRTLGFAVAYKYVESSTDFIHELQNDIYTLSFITITAKCPKIPEYHSTPSTPKPVIIAIVDNTVDVELGILIQQGASDVAILEDALHLKHVISKNIKVISSQHQLTVTTKKLHETQQQLIILLQSSTQPIAYIQEGFHVFANPAYLELFGYNSLTSLQATPLLDLIINADQQQELSSTLRDLQKPTSKRCEKTITFITLDEDQLSYQVLLTASHFDGEDAIQMILDNPLGNNGEILSPKRPELLPPPDTDTITQIYTQHHMLKLLTETVEHARNSDEEYMLYLVHLETGPDDENYTNTCMQTAANRLLDTIHDNDVLGRYTGNSFLLLSTRGENITPNSYAQQLRTAIGDLNGLLLGLTHSRVVGVIIDRYCKDTEDAISRLKYTFIQAQEYHDKIKIDASQFIHAPGSQVMDQVWARRVSTILKNNRLTLTSLPITSLKYDESEPHTLKLQLTNESGECISIDNFKDTVMQTGLVASVNRWIIFNAARQLVVRLKYSPSTQFFIPLIGDVMLEDDLYPWIEKIFKQFNLPANSIALETTVDAALEFPQAFSEYCERMSAINCNIYLTGLDDPTITHELYNEGKNKIKFLALDSNLLNSIAIDKDKYEAVEILVEQCHQHNTLTIVPDVVDPELLSDMWRLGVDMIISTNLMDQPNDLLELDLTATLIA